MACVLEPEGGSLILLSVTADTFSSVELLNPSLNPLMCFIISHSTCFTFVLYFVLGVQKCGISPAGGKGIYFVKAKEVSAISSYSCSWFVLSFYNVRRKVRMTIIWMPGGKALKKLGSRYIIVPCILFSVTFLAMTYFHRKEETQKHCRFISLRSYV